MLRIKKNDTVKILTGYKKDMISECYLEDDAIIIKGWTDSAEIDGIANHISSYNFYKSIKLNIMK